MSAKLSTIASVTAIAAVAAAVTGGTYAVFDDTETVSGYSMRAGTLNLTVNDGGSTTGVAPISISNIQPGDLGSKTVALFNDGSLAGTLSTSIVNISSAENACLEAERDDDSTCDPVGATPAASELDDRIVFTVSFPDNTLDSAAGTVGHQDDADAALDVLYTGSLAAAQTALQSFTLPQQTGTTVTLDWSLARTVGNEVQGDAVGFDMKFDIVDNLVDGNIVDANPAKVVTP